MIIKYINFKYNLTTYLLVLINLCCYGCAKSPKLIFPSNHDYTKASVVKPLNLVNKKFPLPRGTGRYDLPSIKSVGSEHQVDLSPPNYKDHTENEILSYDNKI